jgi:nucleoid-associated protein YgaU
MAIDLRRSSRAACRSWLDRNLLTLEGEGVIEATKERHPPHYHIAVFPKPYVQFLASRGVAPEATATPAPAAEPTEVRVAAVSEKPQKISTTQRSTHIARARAKPLASHSRKGALRVRVGHGDTLWSIAQRHGVSVAAVKRANHLRSSTLKTGQVLAIPAR